MMMRFSSIRGSKSSALRITALVCRLTHRLSEMIWALTGLHRQGGVLVGAVGLARVDHSRRFQSRASMRVFRSQLVGGRSVDQRPGHLSEQAVFQLPRALGPRASLLIRL